jgi:hypothetical protein
MWHRIVILFLLGLLLYEPARQLSWMLTVEEPRLYGDQAGLPRPSYADRFKVSFSDFTAAEQRAYIREMAEERLERAMRDVATEV